LQHHLKKSK